MVHSIVVVCFLKQNLTASSGREVTSCQHDSLESDVSSGEEGDALGLSSTCVDAESISGDREHFGMRSADS